MTEKEEFEVFLLDEYGSHESYKAEKSRIIMLAFKAFLFGKAVAQNVSRKDKSST